MASRVCQDVPDWHREAEKTYGLIPEGLQAARKTLGEISRKELETAMVGFGESLIRDRLGEWVTAPVDLPDAATFVAGRRPSQSPGRAEA